MNERVAAAWARLPDYLSQHVMVSAASLALGLVISLPLAIAATRMRWLRWPLLTGSSLLQTIPGLALLALFYPLLLGLSALSQHLFGGGFSALGFLPSLMALTLYSMLPIVRNAIVGIEGVSSAVREAARGVGMTDLQSLFRVELPLAAPTILAGVRTSAVWVIGTATLATPIGQTSLGNYIFTGLQTENWVFVLFGCAAAAMLALATDQLLGLIERGIAERKRWRVLAGAAGLLIGAALAMAPALGKSEAHVVIGAKTFSEQYILSELIAHELDDKDMASTQTSGLGSTVILRALAANDIDVYVEYSGTVWTTAMGRTDNPGREAVAAGVADWLKRTHGITSLGSLGFENAYALAMRRDRAEAIGARTIGDLQPHAASMKIGGDYEFFQRPEWAAVRQAYGLSFKEERQFQSTFMYRAVADRDVDVISAFSSDGRIASFDLVVLEDPRGAVPPYDALVLLAPRRASDQRLIASLRPMIGAIPVALMQQANEMVDRDENKQSPRAAAEWLRGRMTRSAVMAPQRAM